MVAFAERLAGWIARGRSAFPELVLADASLEAWFRERIDDLPTADDDVPAEDLYLAAACATGDDRAVERFASRHLARLGPALRRTGVDDAAIAEIEQALVALVFVGDGEPHIHRYRGRGPLHRWLESIAVRMALRQRDHDRRSAGDDALADLASDDDPRVAQLRKTAGAELKCAFAAILAALPPRDRTLLRQHHLDGVSLEALAAAHRVHRATVARWLAAARQAVADGTRDALMQRLGLPAADADSVFRLVRSQLDRSLRRQLEE